MSHLVQRRPPTPPLRLDIYQVATIYQVASILCPFVENGELCAYMRLAHDCCARLCVEQYALASSLAPRVPSRVPLRSFI